MIIKFFIIRVFELNIVINEKDDIAEFFQGSPWRANGCQEIFWKKEIFWEKEISCETIFWKKEISCEKIFWEKVFWEKEIWEKVFEANGFFHNEETVREEDETKLRREKSGLQEVNRDMIISQISLLHLVFPIS